MTTPNSNLFFLFFLSIPIVLSSGSGFYLPSIQVSEEKEVELNIGQALHSYRRELVIKALQHDSTNPFITNFPATTVTNPVTTPSTSTAPPDTSTPAVVTIPSTNPVSGVPTPGSVPTTFPPATPTTTNPVNPPVPVTNPVTTPSTNFPGGAQPVTNPAATFPPAVGGVPGAMPAVTPPAVGAVPGAMPAVTPPAVGAVPGAMPAVTPPATTNAPAVAGQSWCVARSGVPETTIQSALDYACGIGGADCSTIQQGGSCYNPNTLQNHASYAFNSYYQKNPVQTSCDFGGAAAVTNVNPSSGSCIFTTLSSSSSPTITNPATPTPTTASSSGAAPTVTGTPPAIFNPGNMAPGGTGMPGFGGTGTGFGDMSPTATPSSASISRGLHPFLGCFILVTSIVAGRMVLNI